MREQAIENALISRVKERGGLCLKLAPYIAGIPDRLVILPGGNLMFVELKRPKGGVVSPIQRVIHARLEALGVPVHIVSNKEEIKELIP